MKHRARVTVIDKKCHEGLQRENLAGPKCGPCPCCQVGDTWLFERADEAGMPDEEAYLAAHDFTCGADAAYAG